MGPESTNGKIVGVIFFAWFLYSLSLSLSLSRSLSLSISLSLSLSLIIIYMHICAWQSADSRVTTDHCRVTLRWVFTKSFLIAWNVQKRCLTVSRRSRDLRPLSRDRSATFFKKISNCLKRPKNVVWQSADGRVTSTTVAWPFSDFFQNFPKSLETSRKRCLTVGRRSRDLRPLSRDRSATFFKIVFYCLKRPKNVIWQSVDGRVTSTTVAWPFSDFFQKLCKLLETSKKRCLTVGRRSRDLNHCRVTVQRLFSKFSQIAWNVQKTLFDSRPTVAWPPTTVAWPFSDFFQNFFLLLETSQKTLFDSRPTVAWPPTTVAWPFSDFFRKFC